MDTLVSLHVLRHRKGESIVDCQRLQSGKVREGFRVVGDGNLIVFSTQNNTDIVHRVFGDIVQSQTHRN